MLVEYVGKQKQLQIGGIYLERDLPYDLDESIVYRYPSLFRTVEEDPRKSESVSSILDREPPAEPPQRKQKAKAVKEPKKRRPKAKAKKPAPKPSRRKSGGRTTR